MSSVFFCLGLALIFGTGFSTQFSDSTVVSVPGHYPPSFCHVTNVVLTTIQGNRTFVYQSDKEEHGDCMFTSDIWPLQHVENVGQNCEKKFRLGIAYTIFYWAGISNYYHLTYDMLIPLYKHMYMNGLDKQYESDSVVFMPTVETRRLQVVNWSSFAFKEPDRYWVKMSEFIAGDFVHLPLDMDYESFTQKICFDEIYFGTPRVDFTNDEFMKGFIKFIKSQMKISETHPAADRMALVSRKGRRKILNEEKLVEALQDVVPTDLFEFSGMTFEEQVRSVQNYTVFAALNGAGLMNSLYLPEHSTAIQMVPYKSGLNVKQYGDLIRTRGPYMEWHNTHVDLHHPFPGDTYNNRPDTVVHIEEFKDIVREALAMSKNAYLNSVKSEL